MEGERPPGPHEVYEHEGRVFGKRFQPLRPLRLRRGISTWLGTDLSSGASVILKMTPLDSLPAAALQRFVKEASILRELAATDAEVPDRPRALEPPMAWGRDGPLFFLARAMVEGQSLRQRLRRGPLSIRDALAMAEQLLRGLHLAHSRGVLHR